jgi:hypothetical protein
LSRRGTTTQVASSIPVDDSALPYEADSVQDALVQTTTVAFSAIFPIILQHNGSVGNNTFFGYANTINGLDTPIVIPVNSVFVNFTFSNKSSSADYTIEFRKNTSSGTAFYSVSKTNTQFFVEVLGSPESFNAGDTIYVKYVDDGGNANDVGLVLNFKAT